MLQQLELNGSNPSSSFTLEYAAAFVQVENPTGSPILFRIGSREIPSLATANHIVPAASQVTFAVGGREFGVGFSSPALVAGQAATLSGLSNRAILTFYGANEAVPNLGSISYQSLSLSQLTVATAYAGAGTVGLYDLGSWGGAIAFVSPAAGSGQAVLAASVSDDAITFYPIRTWTLWPNVPAILAIPRTMRYLLLQTNVTAFAGEPSVSGTISVRASISEIVQLSYNPSGNSLVRTFSLAANGSQQYSLLTIGLPAVSLAAIATAGTGASAATTLLVEASSDNLNWRQVTFRTQRMSQGITLYRALGQLDLFLRVTVFEVGGISALVGSVYFSIPSAPDLAAILNTIQQSLGDNSAPSNTNQDIYHELDTVRTLAAANLPSLPTIHADLVNVLAELVLMYGGSSLNAIVAAVNAVNSTDTTIATNTNTLTTQNSTLHSDLTTIDGHLVSNGTTEASINTGISTLNTTQTGAKTDLDAMAAALTRSAKSPAAAGGVLAATQTNFGAQFTANDYITHVQMSFADSGVGAGGVQLEMWIGGAGAAVQQIYDSFVNSAGGGTSVIHTGPEVDFTSTRTPGIFVGSNNFMWVRSSRAGTIAFTVGTSA